MLRWPHFKTCCFDLAHQEEYLLCKQQHETSHSGSCLAISAVRTLPTRKSPLAQMLFMLVPFLPGEVFWKLRNFSRAGEQISNPPTSDRLKRNVIFSLAASVKSSGKTEVAVIPIRKAALLIYCIFKKRSVTAAVQRADTAQHSRGRNPEQGPTFSTSHPSLSRLLSPQHTTATPPESTDVGIGFCSRWCVKGRVVYMLGSFRLLPGFLLKHV